MPKNLIKEILAGKIFIYPTDTIYGLGCNALNKESVEKIRDIKGCSKEKPLSIIAPSIDWIREHCIVDIDLKKYLPGPFTLILKKKNQKFLSHISSETLGVRIPNCPFCKKIQESNVPFITTSVDISGENPANEISEIDSKILQKVDFVIDVGRLNGKPSTLVINGKEIER
ncbi:MAG: L-threonylcarbamoyladenylate synthase [Candidatus Pacearchaeota archaeon]